jgi:hypothetical protein
MNGRLPLASKNGAFIPGWSRQNPETGEMEFALEKEDFEAVRTGYGCGTCLADYGGIYRTTCPVCGEKRLGSELIVPQWWTSRSIV